MDADLDTLATGLYVTSDDFLADNPQYRPLRPRVGLAPRLTDAELVTLVVLQALLGFTSEARFLRYANTHLRGLFPYLPTQSGYNKRIRAAIGTLRAVIAHLVARTSSVSDDVWVVDSTPVEVWALAETAKRSDLAGWAEYGYCASHSRFLGAALHLVCTLSGLPVAFALAGAKADEREVLLGMLDADPNLVAAHPNQKLMADKNYYGKASKEHSPTPKSSCCGLPATARNHARATGTSNRFGRSSSRSITRSRPNSTSNATADHRGRHIASTATHPRPRRRDLAQRPTRPAHAAIANRLRPLTPWNYSSRAWLTKTWSISPLCAGTATRNYSGAFVEGDG